MTQYTRSAIPGRARPEDRPLEDSLDRMVFGRGQAEPAPTVRSRRPVETADDDAPPEHLFKEAAPKERRKGPPRRKTDYALLPDGAGHRESDGSSRGPLIMAVTLVVIAVFGAVVWNAYSSGLRGPDGGPAPELSMAGPFKTRPPVDKNKPADIDASVFERVAPSRPQPAAAVTPEVRPETLPEAQVEAKPAAPKVEAAKPGPEKVGSPKPAPAKAAPGAPIKLTPQAPGSVAEPALDGAFHPAFTASGAYVVQLAAPSTEAAALAEWARRAKASPGLMAGAEKLVIKADVNGRTVYRLRAGSFASSADAGAFCGAIKASGGACFIARK